MAAERAVLRELLQRELEARVRGSLLGLGWLLLLPLLQLGVLAWVFGHLLPARAGDAGLPYAAFLALGLWPWNLFASSLARGATALTDHAALIGKVAVPLRLYVDARVLACVLIEVAGLVLVLGVLAATGVTWSPPGLLLAPLALAVIALWAWALATALALLQVFLRDVAASLGQLLALGFFLSPVLYSLHGLEGAYARWLGWNPLAPPLEYLRAALTGQALGWTGLWASAAAAMLAAGLARAWLQRARANLEDFL